MSSTPPIVGLPFPIFERGWGQNMSNSNMHIIQLPKVIQPLPPTPSPGPINPQTPAPPSQGTGAAQQPPATTPGTTPATATAGFLDQTIFGIPVMYLLIGAAVYFFFIRK